MQTFQELILSETQKKVLRAYAKECHPSNVDSDAYRFLVSVGLIDRPQDHITDRGLAYAITQCGIGFTWFIKRHKWEQRLASRIALVNNMTKGHPEHIDAIQFERYKILIKYNYFQGTNAEGDGIDSPLNMAYMVTEWITNVLANHPEIPWRGVRNALKGYDVAGELDKIADTREAFVEYVRMCMQRFGKYQE